MILKNPTHTPRGVGGGATALLDGVALEVLGMLLMIFVFCEPINFLATLQSILFQFVCKRVKSADQEFLQDPVFIGMRSCQPGQKWQSIIVYLTPLLSGRVMKSSVIFILAVPPLK